MADPSRSLQAAAAFNPVRSRYKDTAVFDGPRGAMYALFEPPQEIAGLTADQLRAYPLTRGEEGFLDVAAVAAYGPSAEDMWWVVAWASGLIDVEYETDAAVVLGLPPADAVARMNTRAGTAGR